MNESDPVRFTRRTLLTTAMRAAAATPCVACLSGCGIDNAAKLKSPVDLVTADYPQMSNEGAWVRVPSRDTGYSFSIFVRNEGGGMFSAVSGYCDHASCDVTTANGGFRCPCHGATFDGEGNVRSGPAKRDLIRFDTEFDGTTLRILPNA